MALSKLAIGLIAGIGSVAAVGATTAAVVVTRNNNQNTTSVESNAEVSLNDKGEVSANSNTSANVDPNKELARVFDKEKEQSKEGSKTEGETEVENGSMNSVSSQVSGSNDRKISDAIMTQTQKDDDKSSQKQPSQVNPTGTALSEEETLKTVQSDGKTEPSDKKEMVETESGEQSSSASPVMTVNESPEDEQEAS